MNAEDVKLGEAYFTYVGRGANRRIERIIIVNTDRDQGWWAYVPSNRHRCRVLSANDLLGEAPSCS